MNRPGSLYVEPSVRHRTTAELEARLDHLRAAPRDFGTLELVVRRPSARTREVVDVGELHLAEGLLGDSWSRRPSRKTPDRSPHPDMQLNVMSHRVIRLIAGDDPQHQALAGDQLFLDLDLSVEALPTGSRLAIGHDDHDDHGRHRDGDREPGAARPGAVIEVMPTPHTGCAKFVERYGADAMRFVNGKVGRALRLRGLCARVVVPGQVRAGDPVRVLLP
jgi:hypothetical protein